MLVVDSSVFIAHLRGQRNATAFLRREADRGLLLAPALVAWELWRGAKTPTRKERVQALLDSVQIDPLSGAVAHLAGELDNHHRREGTQRPTYDLLIASHALFHEVPLATMGRDYGLIDGLDVIEL